MSEKKLGRLPRKYNPAMPHWSAFASSIELPPIPESKDWTDNMPESYGIMCNDRLGCCTCAAAYHLMQVWSFHGRHQILTEPDQYILQMYEEFCGYNPNKPGTTDNGGVEQDVLRLWLTRGVPIKEGSKGGSSGRSKIRGVFELDVRNRDDIKRLIAVCGGLYIGFRVPAWLMKSEPSKVWNTSPQQDNSIIGGHAVCVVGYNKDEPLKIISWGEEYEMPFSFWDQFVDEAYAVIHPWWFDTDSGKTSLGLTQSDVENQMAALKSSIGRK